MIRFLIPMLLLAAMLAACGDDELRVPPLAPDARVLAFGDSLTAGVGAGPGASYPDVLERLIERPVINAGVPGEATRQGLERLPALLEEHEPDLVVLCLGGNDFLQGIAPRQVEDNLRAMIRLVRDRGKHLILLGVPKPGLLLSVPDLYERLADEFDVPCDDEIIAELLSSPAMKSDALHPNSGGYQRMAEAVAALIDPLQ
jgi:lysophospholipase L1-like esterase